MTCDDSTCKRRSMQLPLMQLSISGVRCEDCGGNMIQEYGDSMLHNQLKKLESLVDHAKHTERRSKDPELAKYVCILVVFSSSVVLMPVVCI
jgi:hypothetical protein